MKKVITLFILTTITTIAFSQVNMPVDQSGRITYKEVFNVNITEQETFELIKDFINQSEFIKSQEKDTVLKMHNINNESESGNRNIINYKVKIPVYYNEKKEWLNNNPSSTIGTFMKDKDVQYGYVECELSFMIEKGKVGYKFTNFVHKHEKKPACGELEQKIGQNTKEFYWEEYKIQVNDTVNKMILDIKGLFRDKGMVEEW